MRQISSTTVPNRTGGAHAAHHQALRQKDVVVEAHDANRTSTGATNRATTRRRDGPGRHRARARPSPSRPRTSHWFDGHRRHQVVEDGDAPADGQIGVSRRRTRPVQRMRRATGRPRRPPPRRRRCAAAMRRDPGATPARGTGHRASAVRRCRSWPSRRPRLPAAAARDEPVRNQRSTATASTTAPRVSSPYIRAWRANSSRKGETANTTVATTPAMPRWRCHQREHHERQHGADRRGQAQHRGRRPEVGERAEHQVAQRRMGVGRTAMKPQIRPTG